MARPDYTEFTPLSDHEETEMLNLIREHEQKHHALMWIKNHCGCEAMEAFVLVDHMWDRYQELRIAEADTHGVMQATVNSKGWSRCPSCSTSFQIDNARLWDGKRHRPCLTRLHLVGDEGSPLSYAETPNPTTSQDVSPKK